MKNIIDKSNMEENKNTIDIKKLLINLKNIGNEGEKEEFIKNYSRIKQEIITVDNILNNSDTQNINELDSKSVSELFELLQNNDDKIFNNDTLSVEELKLLIDICNILENKINDDNLSIGPLRISPLSRMHHFYTY